MCSADGSENSKLSSGLGTVHLAYLQGLTQTVAKILVANRLVVSKKVLAGRVLNQFCQQDGANLSVAKPATSGRIVESKCRDVVLEFAKRTTRTVAVEPFPNRFIDLLAQRNDDPRLAYPYNWQ